MNQLAVQAMIEEALKRGRAEGTQDAVNKARTMMPTILANAYKQAVMDTAGFLARELGPDLIAFKTLLTQLCATGTLPEVEKTTQGGVGPTQRIAPAWTKVPRAVRTEIAFDEDEPNPGTLGAGYASE